tara:strand:+ start:77 stop:358 length:282 start_codon:yes stop_codon:yes gene_type:complete
VCNDASKHKKYKYYYWLDEMIMDLWSEYIDLVLNEASTERCDNKIKMIEFYQNELDLLSKEISFSEANEWRRKQLLPSTTQKMADKLFGVVGI